MTQVKRLNFGRYDVVLSDRYIVNYFAKKLQSNNTLEKQEVIEHKVTTENRDDYRPIFRNKKSVTILMQDYIC